MILNKISRRQKSGQDYPVGKEVNTLQCTPALFQNGRGCINFECFIMLPVKRSRYIGIMSLYYKSEILKTENHIHYTFHEKII